MIALRSLVVLGNGMVGHRFAELAVAAGLHRSWRITVIGEERRPAYDRVNLSSFFNGTTAEGLSLLSAADWYAAHGIELLLGDRVTSIDRVARCVTTAAGRGFAYDALVFATGSFPFVPPVPGRDQPGCFVYRTIDDLEAMAAWAKRLPPGSPGTVIGGGLLGLEAANAVKHLGLAPTVVEFGPRLMGVQIDESGGAQLRRLIEKLGVTVRTGTNTTSIVSDAEGVAKLQFADAASGKPSGEAPSRMVVFSAGIRPRDELAKSAGLTLGARGGIAIDDACRTSDPAIYAIGECAAHRDRIYGLVAPGYHMAQVCVDALRAAESPAQFTGYDLSTKLKLLGVDVASFGDAQAATPGCHSVAYADSSAGIYKKLVLSADRRVLLGGILIGDAKDFGVLHQLMLAGSVLPAQPESLVLPAMAGGAPKLGTADLPDAALICSCKTVTKGAICTAIRSESLRDVAAVKRCTAAGTGCGSCLTLVKDLVKHELKAAGMTLANHLCEHFACSRQDLDALVRLRGHRTFAEVLAAHGRGLGCEICKPAVASILAGRRNEHVLARDHAHLQDSNDRFLANIQRDGTYSVVPRCPGGEITPRQLAALASVAEAYRLYCKITGGQRIDLFGARVDDLPAIWEALIAVGFESGHAYGKALRTVKSCVGTTWCRYGQQDSVGLAVRLEQRYKGLRSPHKLKGGCSGCARECAEAQSKDFGIIATERGYNLHVCGNGGMKPQHAPLLAADLSEDEVVRFLDRFLMFYLRTAERLERTATWFNRLDGGIDQLRRIVIDDALGIAAELEAEMAHLVATYRDEWRTVVEDPQQRARFRSFLNSTEADPSIVHVADRAQLRVASFDEKRAVMEPLIAAQEIQS